jgi:hypothetical protein
MEKIVTEAQEHLFQSQTRRHFLRQCSTGLGMMALGALGGCTRSPETASNPMLPKLPHFAAKAKSVIYLHMAGAPSQLELFDFKPELVKYHGKDCPEELVKGKTFAFIRGIPKMLGPQGVFEQRGQSGAWVSDYLPYFQTVADEVCFLKAMHTDQFNHAPAQLFVHTGSPRLGRPSMGAWAVYGLGSENANLPGYVALVSGGKYPEGGKSIWGSGFLPSVYQGVQCRSDGEPVLYINNPNGIERDLRQKAIQTINDINRQEYEDYGDPETLTRIAQYELAFKMQMAVPEVLDMSKEPTYIHQLYGTTPGKASFANNCLLARKLVENGVRFVQLFDWGWDTHGSNASEALEIGLVKKCRETDQAMSALILDLKQRGLLDDVLVVWGGEFGRTPMQENRDNKPAPFMGRDHHPEAFTIWMAGAGVKKGFTYGTTDDIGYSGVSGRTHVHDLQASIMHLMGMDHERLTFDFQGRPFRLTDVGGKVIREILA